jgi:hypothetical protein
MQHPDEGTIHAWLDGALTPAEASEVEVHTASCAQCRDAVAEARGLIAASSRIVSALDAVPAGVIPARRRAARPWYASTQFRAAAAVAFVAGASLVLINRPGSKSLSELSQRATSAPAAEIAAPDAAAQAEQDAANELPPAAQASAAEKPVAEVGEGTAKRAVANETRTTSGRDEVAGKGSVARAGSALADAAPVSGSASVPVTAPAPALLTPQAPPVDTVRLMSGKSIAVSPVVVTGVAASGVQDPAADLRILGVDSTSGQRVTRYRIATGAELTLTEISVSGRDAVARERRFDAARGPAAPPPPPAPAAAMPRAAVGQSAARAEAAMQARIETLTWVDAESGKTYTLSGRVPRETLEQVRARLQLPKP